MKALLSPVEGPDGMVSRVQMALVGIVERILYLCVDPCTIKVLVEY